MTKLRLKHLSYLRQTKMFKNYAYALIQFNVQRQKKKHPPPFQDLHTSINIFIEVDGGVKTYTLNRA